MHAIEMVSWGPTIQSLRDHRNDFLIVISKDRFLRVPGRAVM